ncbi:Probable xyloglucan galactosyltransferase GT12 [Linum grandiflorum]
MKLRSSQIHSPVGQLLMKGNKKPKRNYSTPHLILFLFIIAPFLLFIFHYTIQQASVERKGNRLGFLFTTLFHHDACSGRYIYVHDLPARFNVNVLKNCRHSLIKWLDMCPYLSNMGLGTRVKDDHGNVLSSWYATYQFGLEVIFHHRMMESYECLTNDSRLASAIFVPFYAGFDVGRYLWGYNNTARDALGVELVKWLRDQPEWKGGKGLWGRDHFFVSGRIAWDLRRHDRDGSQWGSKLMQLPESMNMTMLTVETTSWSNEFAVPYPSYFHPETAAQVHQWQRRVRAHKRRYLFSFVGAPRANMTGSIRGELMKQCIASTQKCKLLNCAPVGKCDSPVTVMEVLQNSIFCLQPAGDSPTRRSIFDSILAGCIPVFFHPYSAYGQYTWHLPRNYSLYSVYIPEELVREGKVNVEERLLQVPEAEVVAMREVVIELIPKVIYGDPRSKSTGFEDAFEIALKGVLQRISNVRRQVEEGNDPGKGFAEPDGWKSKLAGVGRDHEWDKFL